jgi:1,4-alpha-glucan branching enzyme
MLRSLGGRTPPPHTEPRADGGGLTEGGVGRPSTRPGMGAVPFEGGTTFRVWAPHADAVFVTGSFDGWAGDTTRLASDGAGVPSTWSGDVPGVGPGAEYRFTVRTSMGDFSRLDPYSRQVTSSVGNAVVYDPRAFDWGDDEFRMPTWNDLVVYEMHIGTFAAKEGRRGDFDRAIRRLPYLAELGVGAIQVMPPFEFAGDVSWGYNPAHLFAIESTYGGPDAFKRFIRAAHEHDIAVIVDVVYNHIGPSDLDLWRFDGWAEGDWGGIYFYNDERAVTPWGATRPDFGRPEVRTFLRDNALTWTEEFRCDGLRFDGTAYVRSVSAGAAEDADGDALSDGWSLLRWINDELRARQPWKVTIAEDLGADPSVVTATAEGGAGFAAQWDTGFVRAVRDALIAQDDADRDMASIAAAMSGDGDGRGAFTRVIYTESHDDVANGRARLPEEIRPGDAASWWSKKRATLGSALVLTGAGIPMLFQGQELLEDRWFDDTVPVDWSKEHRHAGILRLHRDLIRLRRNVGGTTGGLRGQGMWVLRADEEDKVLVYHRWAEGGPGDDVVVVANLGSQALTDYRVGMPRPGRWKDRFNSDAADYDESFTDHPALDLDADGEPSDNQAQSGLVNVGPYSAVVLSQEP